MNRQLGRRARRRAGRPASSWACRRPRWCSWRAEHSAHARAHRREELLVSSAPRPTAAECHLRCLAGQGSGGRQAGGGSGASEKATFFGAVRGLFGWPLYRLIRPACFEARLLLFGASLVPNRDRAGLQLGQVAQWTGHQADQTGLDGFERGCTRRATCCLCPACCFDKGTRLNPS